MTEAPKPQMNDQQIKVRLFATLRDLAGTAQLSLAQAPLSLAQLREYLAQEVPALAPALPSAIAAINQEYAFGDALVQPGDEVAFFPPVSGGSAADAADYFALTEQAIDLNQLSQRLVSPATGAVVVFSGFVRGQTQGEGGLQETLHLEYEAYTPMALAKMRQVAQEIRERWADIQAIAIVQRVGNLQVGEATIAIACASGHRHQGGFEAARYGIDRLKEIVPVWKKEVRPATAFWVEGDYQPSPSDRAES